MYQAFDYLYYLERAAEVIVKARSTGMPLRVLSDEVSPSETQSLEACTKYNIWDRAKHAQASDSHATAEHN